jgi:PiT family inorganic phosphate transporter
MAPRKALYLTAAAEFAGPFLFGVAIARTVGAGIVPPLAIRLDVILAALIVSIFWNLFTWYFGIPSSSSHALIGGLVGAVAASTGLQTVQIGGVLTVLASLLASPVIGLMIGYGFTRLVFFLARNASLRINRFFKGAQVVTGMGLALGHGTNDAQISMGIITMALVSAGSIDEFNVPRWVVAASAAVLALGTSLGGWRLIRTLGGKFYKIRPVHGFATQVSSAAVVLTAALLGGPVSTTHVVSSAILGVGSAERKNMVRWQAAGNIILAWVMTIPISGLIGALAYLLLSLVI